MTPLFLFLTLSGLQLSAALPRPDAFEADSSSITNNRLAHLQINAVVHNVDEAGNVSQPESVVVPQAASPSPAVAIAASSPSPVPAVATSVAPSAAPVASVSIVSVAPAVVPAPAVSSVAAPAAPSAPAPSAVSAAPVQQSVQASSLPQLPSAAPVSVVDTVVPASSVASAPVASSAQHAASSAAPVPVVSSVAPAPAVVSSSSSSPLPAAAQSSAAPAPVVTPSAAAPVSVAAPSVAVPASSSQLPVAAPAAAAPASSSALPVAAPSSKAPVPAASAVQPVPSTVESSAPVTPEVASAVAPAAVAPSSSAAPVPVPAPAAQSSTTVESSSVVTPEVAAASAPPAQSSTPSSSVLRSSSSTSAVVPLASSVQPSSSLARSLSVSIQNAPATQSSKSVVIQASFAPANAHTTSHTTSSSSSSRSSSSSARSSPAVSSVVESPAVLSRTVASASASSSSTSALSSVSQSRSSIPALKRPSSAVDGETSTHASSVTSTKSSSTANVTQKTLGKSSSSSSSLIALQKPASTATESAETITKTMTSVIDRTHTVTFKTTIVRALPTATLIATPEHSSQASTTSSVKDVSSSPIVHAPSQGTTSKPVPNVPQSAHRPEVTTTVITTIIDNVTVTKTMTFTIIGTPVVPVPADTTLFTFGPETTQGADLVPTVLTSKVVLGSETSTLAVTKVLTVPRAPSPTTSSPPLSFSSIRPPVFASAVSSASLLTTVDVRTRWTTLVTTLTTSQIQTLTTKVTAPGTTGTINTSILSAGTSAQPFNTTVIPTPAGSIRPITTGSAVITGGDIAKPTAALSNNIFVPIGLSAPPAQISSRGDHPVPRIGITNQTIPPQTNKFYANFFLGDRTAPTWTHPYSVAWAKGAGVTKSWGLAISQINRTQVVYGPGTPASYFINPGGLQSVVISAAELGNSTSLTMDQLRAFSASVHLSPASGAPAAVSFPLVQGMGFVTGVFNRSTPFLQSSIFFTTLTYGGVVSGTNTVRYQLVLADNTNWVIYMTPATGSTVPTLTLVGNYQIVGNKAFTGTLQVAKNPSATAGQGIYDAHAGVYPVNGAVQGSTNKTQGTYSLTWTKGGRTDRKLLMFALPHHQQSFDRATSANLQKSLTLWTTTKGLATAVTADNFTMVETNLPYDMGFAPWQGPGKAGAVNGPKVTLSSHALQVINDVAANELAQDFDAQTDLDSMYYSGKALAKFAAMVWATNNVAQNKSLASAGLVKLEASFARFVNNQQIYPLVYDTVWGGAVSSATYLTNNSGVDFGNTYYNDHHFHYGYFVYAASVIGFLDPAWLQKGTNKAWVNMLVRDYANSATNDGYFPFSRMFDWFAGHSWAHGLYETFDGKDEESSSEDTFASYALKMWGRTIGDANMEARGNLMLSIQARSLNSYFLMQSNNTIQPAPFIGNKAAGITFENKVDHTTYFGTNIEYIEGIHMIPINPSSMLTRAQNFITEEWNQYFSNGRVENIAGGWRGILYSNLALINPKAAWSFFADPAFSNQYLDGGASRTWYLALAAGLGGSS